MKREQRFSDSLCFWRSTKKSDVRRPRSEGARGDAVTRYGLRGAYGLPLGMGAPYPKWAPQALRP